jgi:hypothetical protein
MSPAENISEIVVTKPEPVSFSEHGFTEFNDISSLRWNEEILRRSPYSLEER